MKTCARCNKPKEQFPSMGGRVCSDCYNAYRRNKRAAEDKLYGTGRGPKKLPPPPPPPCCCDRPGAVNAGCRRHGVHLFQV
jgi:hypothetical protein